MSWRLWCPIGRAPNQRLHGCGCMESRVRGCGRDGDPIAPDSDLDVAVELVPDPNEEGLGQLIAFLSRARQLIYERFKCGP